ncbi:MAG: hypothetical protein QGH51_06115 [Planctomycetota bacterium]|jgi:hypothetical protein|nr:hypothetical protein [Planctomycetota bacterium]
MKLTRDEAWQHLCSWTKSEALLLVIEIPMRAAAHRYETNLAIH